VRKAKKHKELLKRVAFFIALESYKNRCMDGLLNPLTSGFLDLRRSQGARLTVFFMIVVGG